MEENKKKVNSNVEEENIYLPEDDENELLDAAELLDKLEVLREQYPELDIEALAEDEAFLMFIKDKGDDYLSIYEDFLRFEEMMFKKAEKKYRSKLDRMSSGSGRKKPSSFGLSAAQIDLLTEWNRENPEYSFSPREYSYAVRK